MTADPFSLDHLDQAPNALEPAPPAAESIYLDALNDAQREAVEALDGPVLVLAGAGTGKTRVLTTRIAHLIATGRARPGQILAVTFTNKAAREMQDRVAGLIGAPVEGMAIGTFHSIAARILRYHAEVIGLQSTYTILDADDQLRLLKQLIKAENIDEKRWPARMLAALIDRWKNRALTPDKIPEEEAFQYADGRGKDLYAQYQERLKILNACDFGDLLMHNLTLFQRHGDILKRYQDRFRYILVDEYQDTNVAQYLWLRLLAQAHKNICCVGDDDQSIYGWRGAEVGNILRFPEDFENAAIIRLEQNYRSTANILSAASGLIEANKGRMGKTLWTSGDKGALVRVQGVWDGPEEARVIGEEIELSQHRGRSLNEIAVLVRAGFQTREFEERMITLSIPYRVVGGPRFYERAEIRDAVAYLRVIAQPSDDLAFERIVNTPKRGLGNVTMQRLHALAREKGFPLTAAAEQLIESDELRPQARSSLSRLLGDFARWRSEAATLSHTELAKQVLEESGYVEMWQQDKSPDAPGRLENLAELVRAMEDFENLPGFLEHIALVMENEERQTAERVSLMTLHAAKGLEFEQVFLPGWEEGIFPHQLAIDESGLAGLEEERRLAYVGMTRAKQVVHILFAANRQVHGQWQSALPSRFIDDLPGEHVEQMAERGLYGATHRVREFGGFSGDQDRRDHYGPGWQRARRRRGFAERTRTLEGSYVKTRERVRPVSDFAIGERVFHDKFGYGVIEDVDGDKLEVNFENSGPKKIMDSFVERAGPKIEA